MVEVKDRKQLQRFLLRKPIANAYQLGNFDPAYFDFCRWFATYDDAGDIDALLLLYTGLSLPVVLTAGTAHGITQLFRETRSVVPERFLFQIHEHHVDPLELFYKSRKPARMSRMALERRAWEPIATSDKVVPLGHRDTADIVQLYRHYPDNFFEPYQLESGLYFGVREEEGLVSIAGIHMLSERYDIATIGNLVTAPEYRGHGFATQCTARLLTALFDRVSLVALNTAEDNQPARRTFERLGFTPHFTYIEGRVER